MSEIVVNGRRIGPEYPVYVVAELSANHGGSLDRALELVRQAASAGADAVKLQTYRPDTITMDSAKEPFLVGGGTLWDGRTLFDLYSEAYTPWEWHPKLQSEAAECGIHFFTSPFDQTAVDFLAEMQVPAFKIASFELVDHGLIRYAASKGRPLVMSTGMANADEIDEAIRIALDSGAAGVALLHCNSAYPAPPSEMDLRTIPDMMRRWTVPVGLSDHTLGTNAVVVAVTLGACLIEKHLTLDRQEPGPDSAFSLEPSEFRTMVDAVREAEAMLGSVRYGPSETERASVAFRRSLFVVADMTEGELFTAANVRSIRPGNGLQPKYLGEILGRRAARDVERGTPLSWELIKD